MKKLLIPILFLGLTAGVRALPELTRIEKPTREQRAMIQDLEEQIVAIRVILEKYYPLLVRRNLIDTESKTVITVVKYARGAAQPCSKAYQSIWL